MRLRLTSRPRNVQTFAVMLVLLAALVVVVVDAVRSPTVGRWVLVALIAAVLAAASWWFVMLTRQGRRPDRPDTGSAAGGRDDRADT